MSGGALNASGVEDDVAAYPSFLYYEKSFANFFSMLIVFCCFFLLRNRLGWILTNIYYFYKFTLAIVYSTNTIGPISRQSAIEFFLFVQNDLNFKAAALMQRFTIAIANFIFY